MAEEYYAPDVEEIDYELACDEAEAYLADLARDGDGDDLRMALAREEYEYTSALASALAEVEGSLGELPADEREEALDMPADEGMDFVRSRAKVHRVRVARSYGRRTAFALRCGARARAARPRERRAAASSRTSSTDPGSSDDDPAEPSATRVAGAPRPTGCGGRS